MGYIRSRTHAKLGKMPRNGILPCFLGAALLFVTVALGSPLAAQRNLMWEKIYSCPIRYNPQFHLLSDGSVLGSSTKPHGPSIRIQQGEGVDSLRIMLRNLVLHCTSDYCYLTERLGAERWTSRDLSSIATVEDRYLGIASQLSDLNLYNSDFNLIGAIPFVLPIFSGKVCLYQNYHSSHTLAIKDDQLYLLMMPSQVMFDSVGIISHMLPAIALYNVSENLHGIQDTLSQVSLEPDTLWGEMPAFGSVFEAMLYTQFSGIAMDAKHNSLLAYWGNQPEADAYSLPTGSRYAIPFKRHPARNQSMSVSNENYHSHTRKRYLKSWIYGDIVIDSGNGLLYRVHHAPLKGKYIPRYLSGSDFSPVSFQNLHHRRESFLEVYDLEAGKRVKWMKLPLRFVRLSGVAPNGKILLYGAIEDDIELGYLSWKGLR